ncbi:protein-serine/threonine phosphatase [Malassezia yamatoensis]|uniref:Serine/threonine-protein phosphatase n=1 Tax=Malassezia yamatoensis TaxID=253288 RepID=A0AAJ6CIQ2_9BASI|nr:protein-serine/threonine phosphatase [Malassezia yamatoensis]
MSSPSSPGESSSNVHSDYTSATSADLTNETAEVDPNLSEEQRQEQAIQMKDAGNRYFVQGNYAEAKQCYTQAIALNPKVAAIFSNRAACELKLEQHGLAIEDAGKAIELDAKFVKAYFRRASAHLSILDPKAALPDLRKVLQLEPGNTTVKAQLDATVKLVRRLEFERAIRVEASAPTSRTIEEHLENNTGGALIASDYDGPRLPTEATSSTELTPAVEGKPFVGQINGEFIEEMIQYFKQGKRLPNGIAWSIILGAIRAFEQEPALVSYKIPENTTIDVVGDTHGQFYDFLHLLSLTKPPSKTHAVLFNGDFVDRGSWSVEIALTIFAYKWLYPHTTLVNRGNHETSDMNKVYGFEGECKAKFGNEITFKLFTESFIAIPLATILSASLKPLPSDQLPDSASHSPAQMHPILDQNTACKKFFVVHGGLFSEDDVTLDQISKIDRFAKKQPGQEGLMMELLWSDPQAAPGRGPSKRGVGLGFGPDITRTWCELNGVTAVLRSHEVRQGGYAEEHNGLCCTVFSAPNYCDSAGNLAAFARIDAQGTLSWTTFTAQPHPNIRPMAYANGPMGGLVA